MNKPEIKHTLNEYGFENTSYENKLGIYKLSPSDDCYVKVFCDKEDLEDVENQVQRHVDNVDSCTQVVSGNEEVYVIKGDEDYYTDNKISCLLQSLDPNGDLDSLNLNKNYTITLSRNPDDTVTGSNTDRTRYTVNSIGEVIEKLCDKPYIHKLCGNFNQFEKSDLYELSLRIQNKLGKPQELREVKL